MNTLLLGAAILWGCSSGSADTDGGNEPRDGAMGDHDGGVTEGNFLVRGVVTLASASVGQPSAKSGARIRATIDRDHDGQISASEAWSTTSQAQGSYSLSLSLSGSERVVLEFSDEGAASVFRVVEGAPGVELVQNALLSSLSALSCDRGSCGETSQGILVEHLPTDLRGSARLFNPVTEPDAFPGDFNDAEGNLLISGVFASFDFQRAGAKVTTLESPATVHLRMPRDTWGVIVDVEAGSAATVEVPLYAFDEVKGAWVREGTGHLEDGAGVPIPASALPAIHAGTYDGAVVAVGEVHHFSTWNVDWPVSTHGCLQLCLVDAAGNPAAGATVRLRGISYNGSSTAVTVGADGCACLVGMRSEAPGEDLDQDGISGETQRVSLSASAGGKSYDLGEQPMPLANAACGSAGCASLGTIALTAANEKQVSVCTLEGVVRRGATPVEGATALIWDDSTPSDVFEAYCQNPPPICTPGVSTDANGRFSLTWPILDGPSLAAIFDSDSAGGHLSLWGQRTLRGCPVGTTTITLDMGILSVMLSLQLQGQNIDWMPSLSAWTQPSGYLLVSDSAGAPKWVVNLRAGQPIPAPIVYGAAAAALEQTYPSAGSPAPLASGDALTVWFSGTDPSGVTAYASGTLTVP
ncbi:MAG: hypothetical protein U1E65_27685 [Myxococcota bacterium]